MLITAMLTALGLGAASLDAGLQTGAARPADAYTLHVIITEAAVQLRDRTYGPFRVTNARPRSPLLRLEVEMVKPVTETFWTEMEERLTGWHCSTDATAIFMGGGRMEILVNDPINERSQTVTITRCPG